MKKVLKVLSLALVAALSMMVLASCGLSTNPEKTKKTLEKNGYEVGLAEADDIAEFLELFEMGDGDIKAVLSAVKTETGDRITILYCKNADAAKKLNDNGVFRTMFLPPSGGEKGREGSLLYVGSKQAIKDAK